MAQTSISGWNLAGTRTFWLTASISNTSDTVCTCNIHVDVTGESSWFDSHLKIDEYDYDQDKWWGLYNEYSTAQPEAYAAWFCKPNESGDWSDTWTRTKVTRNIRVYITGYARQYSDKISYVSLTIPPKSNYAVTYNANGGSGAPSSQTKWYGETLALSSTVPTRTGYTFLGWATSASGSVAYASGASYSADAALSLYAVWQAQVSTINEASDTLLDTDCFVSWTPKVSTNKYKLKFELADWSSGLIPSNYISGSSSDIEYDDYTIPVNGVAQKITTSTTGTMTVTLYTYDSNGTLLGSNSTTFTVTVPATCKPSVNSYTVSQTSDNQTVNTWGVYVAGYSKVRCQATGSAQFGASITSVIVTGDYNASGTTSLDSTSGVMTTGTKTFVFKVVDSRGMVSSEVSRTVTVLPYTAPSITGFTAERDASSVTVVKALGAWTYSTVSGNNSVTPLLEYKTSTGATWTAASGSITSGTTKTLLEVFTDSVSYNLRLTVTDSLGNSDSRTVFLPTMFVWMHWPAGGHGVAFGKTSETGNFEVNYDLEVYGDIDVGGIFGVDAYLEELTVADVLHTITDTDYQELASLLAEAYDNAADYYVGQFCTNNNKVWECNTAITGGETWNANHWDEL